MKTERLPWETLSGPVYHASETRKSPKKWVRAGGWVMSVALLLGGVSSGYYLVSLFGALYVLTLLTVKTCVVTERGLEIFYQMRVTTHYDLWNWEEIGFVVREDRGDPEKVALHFNQGNRVRRLFFTRPDAEAVLTLAKRRNPKLWAGDADERQLAAFRRKKW